MINETIPDIITFLRDTYGQLSPLQLKERKKVYGRYDLKSR